MTISESNEPEDYLETIIVKPAWFWYYRFHAPKDAVIEVSAWETGKEDFSLYLLRYEDVREDTYRTERALLEHEKVYDVEDTYTFDTACQVCVLISNIHARTHRKEIHLRVSWLEYPDFEEDNGASSKSSESAFQAQSEYKPADWNQQTVFRLVLLLIVVASPLAIGILVWAGTANTVFLTIAAALTGILSILVGIMKVEVRAFLRLEPTLNESLEEAV
jgi:hypothetical protein